MLRVKYCVLILDGASGWPLEEFGGRTCLELARKPNLDLLASQGTLGLVRTVPPGMEASSACACLSILGYDPRIYYTGRGPIEAHSLGLRLEEGEVAFRCNLVTIREGRMWSYSAGQITSAESHELIVALNLNLGNSRVSFYPGVGYRHICTIKEGEEHLKAICTPPHEIPDKPIADFLPRGEGSELLLQLMERSWEVLEKHPVNLHREKQGKPPANFIWLFWGGRRAPELPRFSELYGLSAALTSGVDLLQGLAKLSRMEVLSIPGVTAGLDNDHAAQAEGALAALERHDLVFIHIEAPDEAAHEGRVKEKVETIERIDREVISLFLSRKELRVLVLPDHPTPVKLRTHAPDPVPFLIWGPGVGRSQAKAFSEREAQGTGLFLERGHELLKFLLEPKKFR